MPRKTAKRLLHCLLAADLAGRRGERCDIYSHSGPEDRTCLAELCRWHYVLALLVAVRPHGGIESLLVASTYVQGSARILSETKDASTY